MAASSSAVTPTDSSKSPPKPATVPRPPDSSPSSRFVRATLPFRSVSSSYPYSCANSLRHRSLSATPRFVPPAKLAIFPTDPSTPLPLPTSQATRVSVGSAHSTFPPAPSSPRRFHSASEISSASVQKYPTRAQSPKHRCFRCTSKRTSRRPAPAFSDRLARGQSTQSRKGELHL